MECPARKERAISSIASGSASSKRLKRLARLCRSRVYVRAGPTRKPQQRRSALPVRISNAAAAASDNPVLLSTMTLTDTWLSASRSSCSMCGVKRSQPSRAPNLPSSPECSSSMDSSKGARIFELRAPSGTIMRRCRSRVESVFSLVPVSRMPRLHTSSSKKRKKSIRDRGQTRPPPPWSLRSKRRPLPSSVQRISERSRWRGTLPGRGHPPQVLGARRGKDPAC